jgi:TATA-box binding protein (TBP) (component of TFIID and TFIIIB)
MSYLVNETHVCDLKSLASTLPTATYNPNRFGAVIYKIPFTPTRKASCLVFSTGRCVVTGTNGNIAAIVSILTSTMTENGYLCALISCKCVNRVYSGTVGVRLDLNKIAALDKRKFLFEPELFCGCTCHLADCTIILYQSGKYILTGCLDPAGKATEFLDALWLFEAY